MRRMPVSLAAGLAMAACSPPVEASSESGAEGCRGLLIGDASVEADLERLGASVEAYCDCFAASLVLEPEDVRNSVQKVVAEIVTVRHERQINVEDAAEVVEDDAKGSGELTGVSADQFRRAGVFVEGVRKQLKNNGGACPGSTG